MRTIAVFTGTRAEYDLLRPLMRMLVENDDCRLHTIVSGAHLEAQFGSTVDEILTDGIPVHDRVKILGDTTNCGICQAMGQGLARYAEIFEASRPHILVVLGDRYETFAMAAAATVMRVPLAHIHGGETTESLIDEPFRHSITKMSHLHFTSCEEHRQRVIQLGEYPERVFNVGSLGVENIHNTELLDEAATRRELDLAPDVPYLLCTMHPVTLDLQPPASQIAGICEALDSLPEYAVVFTGANADPGGSEVNETLQAVVKARPRYRFFMSLGQKRYFSAVKYAACVLGNSSSGIIEIPSFRTPVIDIGDRQKGRVRAKTVLHTSPDGEAITRCLAIALSPAYKKVLCENGNPYDLPGTANRIVQTLCEWPLAGILQKHFYTIMP